MKKRVSHPNRHYCILATDGMGHWLGYVEHSFSMGWSPERVNVQGYDHSSSWLGIPGREKWRMKLESERRSSWNGSLPKKYKGMMGYYRKLEISDRKRQHPCGRTGNELEWKWVKGTADRIKPPRPGWTVSAYRVGSSGCPVQIDTRERRGMELRRLKFDKFRWRNPVFRPIQGFGGREAPGVNSGDGAGGAGPGAG